VEIVVTSDLSTVYSLRRQVLRHGSLHRFGVASDADQAAGSIHLLGYHGGRPVGAMSLIPEACPGRDDIAVEIVGMAVLTTYQRRGVGSALLLSGLALVEGSCDLVWARARCTSIGFYERHGFRPISGVYEILPGVPHRTMVRDGE
jgi:GNAT superfamily N-acetyltransferase